MPWETGSEGDGKYKYYPGGDRSAEPKDAPSAVNVVVVPDVNLPKVRTIPKIWWCRGRGKSCGGTGLYTSGDMLTFS